MKIPYCYSILFLFLLSIIPTSKSFASIPNSEKISVIERDTTIQRDTTQKSKVEKSKKFRYWYIISGILLAIGIGCINTSNDLRKNSYSSAYFDTTGWTEFFIGFASIAISLAILQIMLIIEIVKKIKNSKIILK